MPWDQLGCANCTWWHANVQKYNQVQLAEAVHSNGLLVLGLDWCGLQVEICDKVCPAGWQNLRVEQPVPQQTPQQPSDQGGAVVLTGSDRLLANDLFWSTEPNFHQAHCTMAR